MRHDRKARYSLIVTIETPERTSIHAHLAGRDRSDGDFDLSGRANQLWVSAA